MLYDFELGTRACDSSPTLDLNPLADCKCACTMIMLPAKLICTYGESSNPDSPVSVNFICKRNSRYSLIQVNYLLCCQGTIRLVHVYYTVLLGLMCKEGVVGKCIIGVMDIVVSQIMIVSIANSIPVNTILSDVSRGQLVMDDLKSTYAVLQHAHITEFGWARSSALRERYSMAVPCSLPHVNLLVQDGEEEVVEEPDVGGIVGI